MPQVTLYSYYPSPLILRTVFRDVDDPTYINYNDFASVGTPSTPGTTIVSVICVGVDQYTYRMSPLSPFATLSILSNAIECGYVRPTCDISIASFSKTDETVTDADNGTANLFCVSTYSPITYFLIRVGVGTIDSNNTGYFTGIAPADYIIKAVDTNACEQAQPFTILPYSVYLTHFKYRLKFLSADGLVQWELRLFDMLHNYDVLTYPLDITGTEDPVVYKIADQNEDKVSPIVSSQLQISLSYTGDDFTPDEFTLSPEKSWRVELMNNGITEFIGWVLPDESGDQYADKPYNFYLTATDGLPSLKGNIFGDGSGGQGYGTSQIQQYGLAKWCRLLQQCLNQLGYEYNDTIIVSSLRFNSVYDRNLWYNIGTWSDILYDSSGVPMDTYSALELLLKGLKLCIVQNKGRFVLINWNDLWYINNGVVLDEYLRSFYQFASDFSNINATGADVSQPTLQLIGDGTINQPVQPPQGLTFDKAYNTEEDVSFNLLALLFENPSFEIGAVQDELPPEFQTHGALNFAFCNYDPLLPTNPLSGAADGDWELRMKWNYTENPTGVVDTYIDLITPLVIDQANKLINISFFWRPTFISSRNTNTIPVYALVFTESLTGIKYCFDNSHVAGPNDVWRTFIEHNSTNAGIALLSPASNTDGDVTSWQSYAITAVKLPGSQIGTLNIRIYPTLILGNTVAPVGTELIVDIDMLDITLSDANPAAINQTGEKHIITAVTGVPQANLKKDDLKLFTYPPNKRVAGNVFSTSDYATGVVANTWNYALKNIDPDDRLAATITRSISRLYSRQMYKFEGDVETSYLNYYGIFQLKFYDSVLLMPYSLEGHLRTSIWHVVLIEVTDADAQTIYKYTPIFERSARNNLT